MRISRHGDGSSLSCRGAALMAVLWLIAILAMAAMATLRVISFDMKVASARIHGSRARHMAEMGIAVGVNPVVKRSDPILRQFPQSPDEGFEARIQSEGGRFNINSILLRNDKPLVTSILVQWGIDLKDAQSIADALTDWVDADDDTGLNGAEKKDYERAGRTNQPFNRPFYDLNEMRLVRGMDAVEEVRPDWRDWFTIWSGGVLDLNEARAELIAVAAECPLEQAAVIPQTVVGADGERDTEDDVPFKDPAAALDLLGIKQDARPDLVRRFAVSDPITRIESIGHAEGAKRKITVIVKNRTGKPLLLERFEEIIP